MDATLQPATGSRAIFISEIEQFGGAERSVLALARWLHERSLPAHILTYADRCNLVQHAGFPLRVVELHRTPGALHRISALLGYFQALPPGAPKPLASGYQPALHLTLAGQRGFHDLMHDTPSLFVDTNDHSFKAKLRLGISNRIVGNGLRSGGVTIVTSEYLRQECRRDFGVDAQIVRMGGLGSEVQRMLPRRVRPGEPLRMLSVCRIDANKRLDWILRSLAELEAAAPSLSSRIDWRLDLAGKGPLIAQLQELAASLGIADRVRFLGFVPDEELAKLYDEAHLFVMPAVQGYGIPAIEALQHGIPVLLHRDSGVSDILLDTPWATVQAGGSEATTAALLSAVEGVLAGPHCEVRLPAIPTEDEWAERVAQLCNWVP